MDRRIKITGILVLTPDDAAYGNHITEVRQDVSLGLVHLEDLEDVTVEDTQ